MRLDNLAEVKHDSTDLPGKRNTMRRFFTLLFSHQARKERKARRQARMDEVSGAGSNIRLRVGLRERRCGG
jgi:hypothetical protein